jgi:hypothetical protein
MGLDIYLYNVSKPSNLKKGQLVEQNNNVTLLPVLDSNGNRKKYCNTILKNSVRVKSENKKIDYNKLYKVYSKKDYDNSNIGIISVNTKGYSFNIDGEIITLDTNIIRNNYSYSVIEEYYAINLYEIEYQRGLSDEGREILPPNCEYCDNKEKIDELVKNGLNYSFKREWIAEKTVLLAWW